MTMIDRINGVEASVAVKAPVKVATTANISLSGLQTIDGIILSSGDRVLVKDQIDASQNGIWNVATSEWSRAADFNGARDIVEGTQVFATSGILNAFLRFVVDVPAPEIGISDIVFTTSNYDSGASVAADLAEQYRDEAQVFRDEAEAFIPASINEKVDPIYSQETVFRKIRKLFLDASSGVNSNVSYYIVGDSTRDNSYNNSVSYYYPHMLAKVGVTSFDWARSGHSADEWGNNTSEPSADDFLLSVDGNESNVIVEFSMGLNDFSDAVGTDEEIAAIVRADIVRCLDIFVANDILFFLVTPVWTLTNTSRNEVLQEIYADLSATYGVPLVDVHNPMRVVYDHEVGVVDESKFYHDGTHQWPSGSMRMTNIIFSTILPAELYSQMSMDNEYLYPEADETPVFVSGSYYRSSDGLIVTDADWTRLEPLAVAEGDILVLDNPNGGRDSGVWALSSAFVSTADFTLNNETDRFELIVPAGVDELWLNVDDNGVALLTIQNGFEYRRLELKPYKTVSEITAGTPVNLLAESPDNVDAAIAEAVAAARDTGVFTPIVSDYSPGVVSGSATLSGSYTNRGDRWDADVSFNLATSDNIAVGDLVEMSGLPGLAAVSSSYSYFHVGTFSVFNENTVTREQPNDIAAGVVTMARGSGGRRLFLTVTSVKGTPTWSMSGDAVFRYYG